MRPTSNNAAIGMINDSGHAVTLEIRIEENGNVAGEVLRRPTQLRRPFDALR